MTIDHYSRIPQLVFGFHGCDESVRDKILNSESEHLLQSEHDYEWLGHGVYFWMGDPMRALEWAQEGQKKKPNKIKNPAVIGAIIDLGRCLNLSERECIEDLRFAHRELKKNILQAGLKMPTNVRQDEGGITLLRRLDCAVIECLHKLNPDKYQTAFGFFYEGGPAYEGAGFALKSHAQICVRDLSCIKGYFLPRKS
ncbi:MAG: hypothetical protein K2O41_00670 [Clostridia bacterium]|nr:hypothetical protein [Clostridia bacterium]